MKKLTILLGAATIFMTACNNDSANKDSVEKADSVNEVKKDAGPAVIQTDQATTDFLVKAADGGMAEVAAGKTAQGKATDASVKGFADMMVNDHSGVNEQVKGFAAARNVTLPMEPSEDHKTKAAKVSEKTGKDYDKAYMDMMIDGHKSTISLFEKAQNESNDSEVKTFIGNTLPKLKTHLDSAQAIRKRIK